MIRFRFVDDAQKNHSVKRLCEVLKLNRSSYYKWKRTALLRKKRLLKDSLLGARVKTVFITERGCYGAKRITAELKDQPDHEPVHHKRVARIMRSLKLFGYTKKRKVTTTVSNQKKPVFPDLVGPERLNGSYKKSSFIPRGGMMLSTWKLRHLSGLLGGMRPGFIKGWATARQLKLDQNFARPIRAKK